MAAGPGLVGLAQSDAVRRSGSGGCVVPLPPWTLGRCRRQNGMGGHGACGVRRSPYPGRPLPLTGPGRHPRRF